MIALWIWQGIDTSAPPPPPPTAPGKGAVFDQQIQIAYDPNCQALRVLDAGAASGDFGTHLDWRQVLEACWDSDKKAFRVVFV